MAHAIKGEIHNLLSARRGRVANDGLQVERVCSFFFETPCFTPGKKHARPEQVLRLNLRFASGDRFALEIPLRVSGRRLVQKKPTRSVSKKCISGRWRVR